ncbi:NAD(+) diphosphatase [Isoptericola sp. NEAU-Y5]|uniref:NAD(+) diphosphatase n=1 Tax=Isoptericola luteus TaxID=2879484 RepID=A0ABS7ZDW2_9MICO|nr:NAD(+) diphosphatase [Isoptericola sp. NEAU-Y5]MCA5892476.1 NAD(+) diphosphatase [Isoptericola sp. NEAU-Y5]
MSDAVPLPDLTYTRATHDRAAHRRGEPDLLERLLADATTRVVLVHRGRPAVDHGGMLALLSPGAVADVSVQPEADGRAGHRWLFLGEDLTTRGAYLALVLPDDADTEAVDIEGVSPAAPATRLVRRYAWAGLRALGGRELDGLAAEAVALAAWHAAHARCARCGEPTVVEQAGWVRRCVAQDVVVYPRTDPAVIMAVVDDDDRLLLGHAAHWPEGRFSTLAGYVEPGEGLEQAVRREVAEETSVEISSDPGGVLYRGSQPWPFPASLMLGFRARARTTQVRVDGVEVTQARWFTRAELARAVDEGQVGLPGRPSIARALIEEWFGGPIDEP